MLSFRQTRGKYCRQLGIRHIESLERSQRGRVEKLLLSGERIRGLFKNNQVDEVGYEDQM